jgi:hypothetical protein
MIYHHHALAHALMNQQTDFTTRFTDTACEAAGSSQIPSGVEY